MEKTWSEELERELRERWTAGQTSGEIARAFGVTRNSVIGKVTRLKLTRSPKPKADKPVEAIPSIAARPHIKRRHGHFVSTLARLARKPAVVVLAAPTVESVSILDVREGQCKWVTDTATETSFARMCGQPVRSFGEPWCSCHRALCYMPPRVRAA